MISMCCRYGCSVINEHAYINRSFSIHQHFPSPPVPSYTDAFPFSYGEHIYSLSLITWLLVSFRAIGFGLSFLFYIWIWLRFCFFVFVYFTVIDLTKLVFFLFFLRWVRVCNHDRNYSSALVHKLYVDLRRCMGLFLFFASKNLNVFFFLFIISSGKCLFGTENDLFVSPSPSPH